jgi:hypothetical protein
MYREFQLAFAELQIGDAHVFLNDEFLEAGVSSPDALHGARSVPRLGLLVDHARSGVM